ncbi:hypothetical protein GH975_09070 [Litorivicinus lipolyticus]|uniref:HTH luxR-type domain-containing protein n=1 Tax=Litorivicinus lipolyticus TaxID=418701 RepID=A0A5Q2QEB8_9GAMM|nr:response regulator transcription factor [Litorivicinus lipolyticus]QGG80711.1 hypothetical protein GH975_09070 [Litorivicinus lipolyticus]
MDKVLNILTIGRDPTVLGHLATALSHHKVRIAAPSAQLDAQIQQQPYDMLIAHITTDHNTVDLAVSLALVHENIPLLVVDDHPDDEMGRVLIKAGARGYAHAGLTDELIAGAVRDIIDGELWMPRSVMLSMMNELTTEMDNERVGDDPRLGRLTKREREVVELVAKGASNKDVADHLGLTVRTVKAHMTSAFQKTGTSARLEMSLLVRGELPMNHGMRA